jgi:hypothetical protein
MTTSELERRLSEATGGSRELDDAVDAALWPESAKYRHAALSRGDYTTYPEPAPVTSSIDAALALVERKLPGWWVQVSTHGIATIQRVLGGDQPAPRIRVTAATPALAICLCLIRALATQEPTNGK